MNKIFTVGLIIAILLGGYAVFKPAKVLVQQPDGKIVGAITGPNVFQRMFLDVGSTNGGRSATTTGAGIVAYTTNRTDFANTPTVVSWNPNANQTVTLTSTSTFGYVPKIGDTANVYLRNASTTAGATITFAAANANVDLQFAEATGGDLVLNGLDWAKLTFIRTSEYVVTIIFDEMTEAD